uniref:beta strand repeat-containing protein n=1 Tax=Anaerobiospirillum succiniciproducens TaxID=13335 RepID=UPI00294295BC
MKQTNNAIKFLMAQYRAIFKNANIAMLAAIAASALAAGQAQAATTAVGTWAGIKDNAKNGAIALDHADPGFKLQVSATADASFTDAITATISSGAHTIDGDEKGAWTLGGSALDIKIADGGGDDAALNIGGTKGNITVAVNDITVTKGTLAISRAAATAAKSGATVTAKDVVVGGTAGSTATVTIDKFGTLSSDTLSVGDAAAITVAENGLLKAGTLNMSSGSLSTSGKVEGSTINVTGGTVTFAANTGILGSDTSSVTISGGTVTATKAGAIKGSSVDIQGGTFTLTEGLTIGSAEGTVDVKGGTFDVKTTKKLTFVGKSNLTGGTITTTDAGELAFKGNATINGTTLTLGDNAVTNIETDATTKTSTLNVSAATFGTLVKKDTQKIKVTTTAADETAVLRFTDTDTAINLAKTGGVGVLKDDGTGLAATNFAAKGGDGVFAVSAAKAEYKKDTFAPADAPNTVRIVADELTVGENSFTITAFKDTDTLLQVGKTLTVGDGSKNLTISKGKVDLEGVEDSKGNSVAAGKITLGVNTTSAGNLNVTAGEWTVKGLEIISGAATVANKAVLKVTGDLTTTNANGKLVGDDSAIIDASGVVKLTLAGQGAELKNTSTLILDKADVFDGSGNVIQANYADGAVTGSANSTINIMDGKELATISREKFQEFTKKAAFKGLWGVKVDGLVPENTTEMNIGGNDNALIPGVGTGYENVQAKVDGTKPIDNNYSAGSVVLSSGDSLAIGTGSMSLQNANAHDNDGMFVSKPGANPTDKATLAGVNFGTGSTADSSLTLQGSGKIGAITADAAGSGSVTFGAGAGKTGNVDVEGKIGAGGAELAKLVNNGSTVSVKGGDVFAHEIDLNGGSFNVAG